MGVRMILHGLACACGAPLEHRYRGKAYPLRCSDSVAAHVYYFGRGEVRVCDNDTTRDAVFVFHPAMAEAGAQIVRRCYPGAVTISGPYPAGPQPVVAFAVSREALAAAGSCGAPADGVGLLARYFSGAD